MSIRQNAIDSICLGVEDYQSTDPKRLVSSVRNFTAGILLLLKHSMIEAAGGDEAVIRKIVVPKVEPDGVRWEGEGPHTVDVQQIIDRCESLGINVDWAAIKHLQKYRNDIEHYFSTVNATAVRGFIAGAFVPLHDLITNKLKEDPRDFLGTQTWDFLVKQGDVFAAEKKACAVLMAALTWSNSGAQDLIDDTSCEECGSELIRPAVDGPADATDATFKCSACGDELSYEELLQCAIHQAAEQRRPELGERFHFCPNCENEGYDSETQQCVHCGAEGPYDCMRCSNHIPVEELIQGGKMCGWCVHMSSKDD